MAQKRANLRIIRFFGYSKPAYYPEKRHFYLALFPNIPIEVKSGKRYTTTSLDRFIDVFGQRIGRAYIIHTKNLSVRDKVVCIPCYMTMCL